MGTSLASFVELLGEKNVLRDAADLTFYSQDVYAAGTPPLAVLRPGTVEELSRTVMLATDAGLAVVPRGGGMSYTDGYLPPQPGCVTIDLQRLDRVVEVNAADRYVIVECGATWKALHDALAPLGLRTPYWGPLSGVRATIGGALSQGSMFLGSGLHGPAQDSLLGLEVVLADGSLLKVGGSSITHGSPFFRHHGPDLSGIFTGDCGALGIKARAALRLIDAPPATRFLSFSFTEAGTLFAAMSDIARAGLASECFAFDPGMQKVRMKRVRLADDVKALGQVMKSAGGIIAGLKEGAKVVMAGRDFLEEGAFSVHFGTEGRDEQEADARASAIRKLAAVHGREVENTIPKVMRANPFTEVNSMLGPEGERWVPVHGTVPFSHALEMYRACEALFERHAADTRRLEIEHGFLCSTIASTGMLLEPVFYWPDARLAFHERVLDRDYVARLPSYPENPEARALVARLRGALADLFMQHGAVSFQIGRFYRYQQGLEPSAAALLATLKRQLDPRGLMNPGALGLR
jgi:FAD/FMN-containing dehydrogenase